MLVSVDASGSFAVWESDTGLCVHSAHLSREVTVDRVQGVHLPAQRSVAFVVATAAQAVATPQQQPTTATAANGQPAASASKSYTLAIRSEDPVEKFARLMGHGGAAESHEAASEASADAETAIDTQAQASHAEAQATAPDSTQLRLIQLDLDTFELSEAQAPTYACPLAAMPSGQSPEVLLCAASTPLAWCGARAKQSQPRDGPGWPNTEATEIAGAASSKGAVAISNHGVLWCWESTEQKVRPSAVSASASVCPGTKFGYTCMCL